jgi:prevent-host-death family protein
MKFITVSELRANASQIISEIEESKEPVAVTKNGKPVVLIQFVTEKAFEPNLPMVEDLIALGHKLGAEIAKAKAERARQQQSKEEHQRKKGGSHGKGKG